MSSSAINTAAVAQSVLALVVAISVTETVRDTLGAYRPASPARLVAMRVIATILIIIAAGFMVQYHVFWTPVEAARPVGNGPIETKPAMGGAAYIETTVR